MDDNKPSSPRGPSKHVRKPNAGESHDKRKLPPELEALASGAIKRLPRPRKPAPPLQDPRGHALMPGVSNKDVRQVYDARVAQLRGVLDEASQPLDAYAAEALCEAVLLGLWRGRNLTSFDAFAEDVLGMSRSKAHKLAEQGAEALGVPLLRLPDEQVAAWLRAEAALEEEGLEGRVTWVGMDENDACLRIELTPGHAARALAAIGRREEGLLRLIASDALHPQGPGARGGAKPIGVARPPTRKR